MASRSAVLAASNPPIMSYVTATSDGATTLPSSAFSCLSSSPSARPPGAWPRSRAAASASPNATATAAASMARGPAVPARGGAASPRLSSIFSADSATRRQSSSLSGAAQSAWPMASKSVARQLASKTAARLSRFRDSVPRRCSSRAHVSQSWRARASAGSGTRTSSTAAAHADTGSRGGGFRCFDGSSAFFFFECRPIQRMSDAGTRSGAPPPPGASLARSKVARSFEGGSSGAASSAGGALPTESATWTMTDGSRSMGPHWSATAPTRPSSPKASASAER
mmetsp:Transcript_3887/g.13346  ORF Transcript_3887/g.13346 Transcript_3887/m.13346 type:complete len:282 (-) Transcript_3887:192-1037(-)